MKDISESTGKTDIHFLQLDLADLAAVRKAAEEYLSKEQELHVLINNAGVLYAPGIGPETAQGYDAQFGIHVLGHHFFTKLLMPALLRTAKGEVSGKPQRVRIVTVSSDAHEGTAPKKGIVWESLERGDKGIPARTKLKGFRLYGQSKLGNVLISSELARRYGDQGVVAISLHPGGVDSQLLRHLHPIIAWIVIKTRIYPISLGVITSLYAATSEAALDMNGEYLTAWARRQVPSKCARDAELAGRLWKWCEDQVDGF
ncbi:NAD-P-binding protein [Roridomyces roridus]|uniref:NAD-P-binding protein n=1 Tax=Roridomyces roridus TaxID=1738132 RepID=A0AAD7FU74_9AGAR|nr:NAD-P-binding protein [Roridomyces roridus]